METNNKLIAEFLGYNTYESNGYINIEFSEDNTRTLQDTHYHSDWNWLMQVVEKIEAHGFTFEIKKNWSCITRKGERIIIRWEEDNNKIEAVYNACLQFIQWYNQNKI